MTLQMHRKPHEDDVKACMESFEHTAIQMGLDRLQWAIQLGSLIMDKAQATYRALPREDAYDYEKVKAAILHHLELTPKHCCKLF